MLGRIDGRDPRWHLASRRRFAGFSAGTGLAGRSAHVLLKIDAQGFKLRVREGAGATLRSIGLHQIELSLVPLYDGGPLLPEMITWLAKRCYRLFGL